MTATTTPTLTGVLIPDPSAESTTVDQAIGSTIELLARDEEVAMQYFHLCLEAFGFVGAAAGDYAKRCGIDWTPGWSDVDDSEL